MADASLAEPIVRAESRAHGWAEMKATVQAAGLPSSVVDRERLVEAIIQMVQEDRRLQKAIVDLVLTCPNVVVQY